MTRFQFEPFGVDRIPIGPVINDDDIACSCELCGKKLIVRIDLFDADGVTICEQCRTFSPRTRGESIKSPVEYCGGGDNPSLLSWLEAVRLDALSIMVATLAKESR